MRIFCVIVKVAQQAQFALQHLANFPHSRHLEDQLIVSV